MQPVSPLAPAKPKGTAGLWIGAALILVGVVGGVLLVVGGIRSIINTVDSYQRVPLSGGSVTIDETGTFRVYVEQPGINERTGFFFQPRLVITDPQGRSVPLLAASGSETYSWNGHDGRRLGRFTASVPGQYRISTASGEPTGTAELAVGKDGPRTGLATIGGGVAGGILAVIAGIIVMIVSGVRRSRSRRELSGGYAGTPMGGWAPPPMSPGAYPAQYPPTGAGQSGWPQGSGATAGPAWSSPAPSPSLSPGAPGVPGPGWAPPPPAPGGAGGPGPTWQPPPPPPGATGPGWAPPPPSDGGSDAQS